MVLPAGSGDPAYEFLALVYFHDMVFYEKCYF